MTNNEQDQPVRKTWIMLKKAAPEYATEGLTMHFCGEDGYVGNNWVSRINPNDKLNAWYSKYKPTYNAEGKYYQSYTQTGYQRGYAYGFRSNFSLTTSENFAFEIVTRNIKAIRAVVSGNHAYVAAGNCGSQYGNWTPPKGSVVLRKFNEGGGTDYSNYNKINLYIQGDTNIYKKHVDEFADDSLDTFTIVPGQGLYHNGVKVSECGVVEGTTLMGIMQTYMSYETTYTSANRCKVHAVRVYNRKLTDDEILKNHKKDILVYGG